MTKQAEQEPVACERCEELAADKGTWYRMAERFAIRNEELNATYELDGLNGTKSYHEAAEAIRARGDK